MEWMDQIELMLHTIHQADVVWGDAKAANFLIDKQDNAWIFDFGGSYMPRQVNKDKKEAVEEDLQGLSSIKYELGFVQSAHVYKNPIDTGLSFSLVVSKQITWNELDIGWYRMASMPGRRLFPSI